MATTTYLGLTKIEASQSQKEVTANAAFDALDAATAGRVSKSIASASVTLTADEALNPIIILTGTMTGARTVSIPVASVRFYLVSNQTAGAYTVTVKTPSGAGVIVPQGSRQMVYCDGTNVVSVASDAFPVAVMKNGKPTANEILGRFNFTSNVTFPASLAGSYACAETAATADTEIDVRKKTAGASGTGSSVGTITFAAGNRSASFTMASATTFAPGEQIIFVGDSVADATLEDLAITLRGVLA